MKDKRSRISRGIVVFLCFLLPETISAQLRINEFSQGASGNKEYIELVVAGDRTCTDSCADIREWIVDDNSGWLGAGSGQGIATGCLRFSNDNNWACVPYGSIILIYNDGDMNGSVTQQPDPTDNNNDNVYVVPVSSSYLDRHPSLPVSPSSLSFVYPATGFTNGGSWSTMGLANTGDAVIVTSPGNLGQAYHSFGYGSISGGNNASVYLSASGSQTVYYLTDDQHSSAASWVAGSVPNDETPGMPNTITNATWINGMLTQIGGVVTSEIFHCINPGNTFFFNNQNLTAAGLYNDSLVSVDGCDSVVTLHLQVIQASQSHQYQYGCGSLLYQGNTYTSSVDLNDTLQSTLGCDSIVNITHIVIQNVTPVIVNSDLAGCGSVEYNGTDYFSSTVVSDTVLSIAGCDSVYANLNITVYPQAPLDAYDTVSGCGKVVFNGQQYFASTLVTDTAFTIHGCDSIYTHTSIEIVAPPGLLSVTPSDTTICPGSSVRLVAKGGSNIEWPGLTPDDSTTVYPMKTGTYMAVGEASNGCNDTAYAQVVVEQFEIELSSNEPKLVKGDTMYLITSGNFPYTVTGWAPGELFPEQQLFVQQRVADISRSYKVFGESEVAGCKDTSTIFVEVDATPTIYFPNVFTPNGDRLNDFIFPLSSHKFTMINFVVFNRWGNLVYEWQKGDNSGWNGMHKGVPVDQGVFVYYFKLTMNNGEIVERKGNLTLLR